MKYALVLLITLLLSLTAFSQTGTDTSKLILSHSIGKQIALDLISYDSTKSALQFTENVLKMTENKCNLQDTVIKTDEDKISIYKQQIILFQSKEDEYQKMISKLESSLKLEKIRGRSILYTGVGVFIAGSLYIITHQH
jgi:hypothetical protein